MSLETVWAASVPFILVGSFVGSAFLVKKRLVSRHDMETGVFWFVLLLLMWPLLPFFAAVIGVVWFIGFAWRRLADVE